MNFYENDNNYPTITIDGTDSIIIHKTNSLIPELFKKNIAKIFDFSLTDFKPLIKLNEIQENQITTFDYDSTYINSHYTYKTVIPKYTFFYLIKDTILFNEEYSLTLSFDTHGQLLGMNWPREGFNKKTSFLTQDELIQIAKNSQINASKKVIPELIYDNVRDKFVYKLNHFKKRQLYQAKNKIYFDVIIIDPKTKKIIDIYHDTKNLRSSCGGYSF
jgi:hypothetical protein